MSHSHEAWYALRVRSKCEPKVARALEDKGYEQFVPAYPHQFAREGSLRPYFPGYIFCRFDPWQRLPILKTPFVLHVVSFGASPAEVGVDEIEALKRLVKLGLRPEPCPYIQKGMRVRVVKGALSGLEGIVLRDARRSRLVISVALLMRSVSVEINESFVIPTVRDDFGLLVRGSGVAQERPMQM